MDESDYADRVGTIVFWTGETRKTRTITVVDDDKREQAELIWVVPLMQKLHRTANVTGCLFWTTASRLVRSEGHR